MEIPNDKQKIKKEETLVYKNEKIPDASAENKIMKKAKIENKFEKEIRKNKRKSQKSYSQHVKERMDEYQENKPIKRSIKLKIIIMGKWLQLKMEKNENVLWKKPQKVRTVQIEVGKSIQTHKHSRERKKFLEQQITKKNPKAILSKTFYFDPEEYLDKSLLFDLKKTREEKNFDSIFEKIPDTDTYYIEDREVSNPFKIRKDRDQSEKDWIIETIENTDKK